MTTPNTIPAQAGEIEQVGTVDLVVGLVDQKGSENLTTLVATVRKGLEQLAGPMRTALVLRNTGPTEAGAEAEGVLQDDSLQLLSYSLPASDSSVTLLQSTYSAYRALGDISQKLGARACAVLASPPENFTAEWISGLVQPILEQAFDLVTPCYEPHRFEGLLNGAILSPLTCALYGKQLENPSGPDLGFSALLYERVLQADSTARGAGKRQFPQIGEEAIVKGLKVCQAHLGRRVSPSVDWKNLDSVLAESLDPLFSSVERNAPFWQHIRSSEPVPTFGVSLPLADESVAVDVRRLLEPFKLGVRNLQELWSLILPPSTLVEIKKADRLAPEEFRIPDEVWTRIVYDFALAYRLRTMARDHLLRALTPLYLGWIASYAVEVESLGSAAVPSRWERLCRAYESGKPYFVSRWRWPDRFNP
jgi:hypothetical protein